MLSFGICFLHTQNSHGCLVLMIDNGDNEVITASAKTSIILKNPPNRRTEMIIYPEQTVIQQ